MTARWFDEYGMVLVLLMLCGLFSLLTLKRQTPDSQRAVKELVARATRELDVALEYVTEVNHRREAFEDLLWALLNSSEFLYRR